jgi:hypothetical protein
VGLSLTIEPKCQVTILHLEKKISPPNKENKTDMQKRKSCKRSYYPAYALLSLLYKKEIRKTCKKRGRCF